MRKQFLLVFAFLFFATTAFALNYCNYWDDHVITGYVGRINTTCGICYLSWGSTEIEPDSGSDFCYPPKSEIPNSAANDSSKTYATASPDLKTIKFYHKTPNGKLVHIFDFQIVQHVYRAGINDDGWFVKLSQPFQGISFVFKDEVKEGSSWSLTRALVGGGTGAATGGTAGAVAGIWTGPGALITGGIGAAAGTVVGVLSSITTGVAEFKSTIGSVSGIELGTMKVTLDHDSYWWAQLNDFEVTLNPQAIELIDLIESLPNDELQKAGFANSTAVWQKLGQIQNEKKLQDQLSNSEAAININKQGASSPAKNTQAILAALGLTAGSSGGKKGKAYIRLADNDFVIMKNKGVIDKERTYSGIAAIMKATNDQTVTVTYNDNPGDGKGTAIQFNNVTPGIKYDVTFNFSGFISLAGGITFEEMDMIYGQ